MIIRDPNGQYMHITKANMGLVMGFCADMQQHSNRSHKSSFSATFTVTPTGAGDCFFYILNDDNEELIISSLKISAASAETVQMKLGDTGTVGGTHAALTLVSRYGGSGTTFEHTCEYGVDITGLAGGSVVDTILPPTTTQKYSWASNIVLPKNIMMSLWAVTGAIAINATVSLHWWDKDHD